MTKRNLRTVSRVTLLLAAGFLLSAAGEEDYESPLGSKVENMEEYGDGYRAGHTDAAAGYEWSSGARNNIYAKFRGISSIRYRSVSESFYQSYVNGQSYYKHRMHGEGEGGAGGAGGEGGEGGGGGE